MAGRAWSAAIQPAGTGNVCRRLRWKMFSLPAGKPVLLDVFENIKRVLGS